MHIVQNIKKGLEGHPASWYSDIFELVFPNLDREQANKCKVCEWKKTHGSEKETDTSDAEKSE